MYLRVGHVQRGAVEVAFGQRPIENLAGRADERRVAQVLLVAGLLADEHDPPPRERREIGAGRNERRCAAALSFDPKHVLSLGALGLPPSLGLDAAEPPHLLVGATPEEG